ncbi:hypothetical protein ACQP25_44580 (plasmid) [Microtetraspora malaysiensis]|uniref:hypothetical protein n=1 Tax=Microtetraspora malaysiensis TaxID=161358 RepID=UPI003D902219
MVRALAPAVAALAALLLATPAYAAGGITTPGAVTPGTPVTVSATTTAGTCQPSLTVTTPTGRIVTVASNSDPLCGSAILTGTYTPAEAGTYTVAVVDGRGGTVETASFAAAAPAPSPTPTATATASATPTATATGSASPTGKASPTPTTTVDMGDSKRTPKGGTVAPAGADTPSPSPILAPTGTRDAGTPGVRVTPATASTLRTATPTPSASETITLAASSSDTATGAASPLPGTTRVSDEAGIGTAFGTIGRNVAILAGICLLVVLIASRRRTTGRHGDSNLD